MPGCQLQRIVFGYHPYWMGSAYLNYQWNLLSDLCYFSYEVDPASGHPVSVHEWLTDPAIDSALANDVRVHLCVTLFSGHTAFFANPAARSTLISNLITLVSQRGAHGINLDFEAVPSSQGNHLTAFVEQLAVEMESQLPGAILSIAIPAVNWNNTFDIAALEEHIDLFMVMAYDYYWNGSGTAGPVSPFYSLTSGYDYSISRTLSSYQAQGISPDHFILGIPYYGRQWLTQSSAIPSPVLANGMALTYANIMNNGGGNYSPQNYLWEPNSFSSAYVFFQNSSWNQCFIGLERDAGNWYDAVNYRNLAGIGIWALGYDNGHTGLWQAIADKLTDCATAVEFDTLYDSGGPSWNYYDDEEYTLTVGKGHLGPGWLTFQSFQTEAGYDSLWIYAGPDTLASLLGGFSGSDNPGTLMSPDGTFTLHFRSDALGRQAGWEAVYHDGSLGIEDQLKSKRSDVVIHPNPSSGLINIAWSGEQEFSRVMVTDIAGRPVFHRNLPNPANHPDIHQMDLSSLAPGIYFLKLLSGKGGAIGFKIIIL